VNRTDRLLAIVLELQARGAARAQDLAEHFETSKRTIYRDIEALCEAGVPVVATPGRGYALMEGYFLPPLSFGVDEAMTLLLGADFVGQRFDPQYQAAARAARRKIEAVLPERHRPESGRSERDAARQSWPDPAIPHTRSASTPRPVAPRPPRAPHGPFPLSRALLNRRTSTNRGAPRRSL
jgi:predicted DNA-binding transcriptional regulator YafY